MRMRTYLGGGGGFPNPNLNNAPLFQTRRTSYECGS